MIGLEDLPAFIQLVKAAFGDPNCIAATNRKMWEMKQLHSEFFQYYAEFQVITPDLDWNPSALSNALGMRLFKEMNNWFTYRDMPEELHVLVMVCQKWDNYILQRCGEKAIQT